MNTIESLKKVPLFTNLSEKNLKRVEKVCKVREFKTDDVIVRQGDEGVGLFIIASGQVKIMKRTDDDRQIDIATHGPGEFFGEFSVIDGAPRSANVIALEPTTCLVAVSWDFRSLMDNHPRIALQILPVVVMRFRETNERLLSMTEGGAD